MRKRCQEVWALGRLVWFQRCRVNQGHPSIVDTIVTNAALFQALPGKILWDWVGLARWGTQSKVKQV